MIDLEEARAGVVALRLLLDNQELLNRLRLTDVADRLEEVLPAVDVELFSDRVIGDCFLVQKKEGSSTSEQKISFKEIDNIEDNFAFEDVFDKSSQITDRLHCPVCTYTTNKRRTLRYHKQTQHELKVETGDAKPLTCSACGYITNKRRTLRYHEKTQHELKVESGESEMLCCSVCDYKSDKKRNLRDHIRVHHKEGKDHSCVVCNYKTRYPSSLRRHEENEHGDRKGRVTCTFCEYSTRYKHSLKLHTHRVHLKSETFKCEMCAYSTDFKRNLMLHMDGKHNDARFFPCSFDG